MRPYFIKTFQHLTGAELVFGNDTDDVIHAVTNRDITVTFDVVFDNCSSKAEEILIKVTEADSNVTECHVIRSATVCDVTRMTSSCHCLSSSGPVVFSKTFSRHGNVTYRWTGCCWRSEKRWLTKLFVVSVGPLVQSESLSIGLVIFLCLKLL